MLPDFLVDLVEEWEAVPVGPELRESFTVAPTNRVYALDEHLDEQTGDRVQRQVRTLQWGPGAQLGQGREGRRPADQRPGGDVGGETVVAGGVPQTSRHGARSRALRVGPSRAGQRQGSQRPFYLHPGRDRMLAFAGLYELWRDPGKAADDPDRWLWTTVIITADATGPAGEVYDRTPLILPADRVGAWPDPRRTDPDDVYAVLEGVVLPPLAVRPVSTQVNRVGNNGPHLLDPVNVEQPDEPLQFTFTGHAA